MERKKNPSKKLGAGQQTLGQFLDFDEQIRRGEIEEVSVDSEIKTPDVGIFKAVKLNQKAQVALPTFRKGNSSSTTTATKATTIANFPSNPFNVAPSGKSQELDKADDSSDSDCDGSNYRSIIRSLTLNQHIKTPESNVTSISTNSSGGGSFTPDTGTNSDDSPGPKPSTGRGRGSRTKAALQDFSDIYYPKPLGVGRGRGRGRGIGFKSGYLRSDSPSNEIPVDISTSSEYNKISSTKYQKDQEVLDSDDDDAPTTDINNGDIIKEKISSNHDSPSSKPLFSPKRLIDKPEKITKHSSSTPLDFPGRLLTRGPLLMSPLGVINHFVYYKALAKGIKNCGIDEFNSLQKSVAPHFLRTDDCFITGGIGSGKTLSYLIPMIGKLLAESTDDNFSQNKKDGLNFGENNHVHQPVAIIVCSDKRSATKIDGHLYSLLSTGNQRQLSYALVCEGKDRRNVHRDVDIIITSVHFFSNMIKNSSFYLGFEKLRFFVFEDVDILLRAYRKEFDHLQNVLSNIAAKHSRFLIQRVFCGKEWCTEVEDLYMTLEFLHGPGKSQSSSSSLSIPTIFINSSNQVIKYSEMKWFMHHCAADEKTEFLISLLKSVELYRHKSIFVLCSTAEIAMMVHHELKRNDVYACLAETENMTQATIPLLKNEWEDFPSHQRIMVLNDTMLRGLHIFDVTCLINYDMPSKMGAYIKSSTGADRFSCMWANFRDIATEKVDPTCKSQRVELAAHFLLTGEETVLHKLKSFAANISCDMPASLIVIANKMEKEVMNKLPICNGIKEFGRCVETVASNCKCRHSFLLSDLEKASVVPNNGEIEVRISECINPTTYTAQVLRCFEYKDGKCKLRWSWIQNYKSISDELKKHFEVEENRHPPVSFDVGSLCAIQNSDGIFRARILQILTRTELNYPKQLRVFCIDSGYFLQPSGENLFFLPDDLQNLPQLAVELILGNLQPMDGENGYDSVAKNRAKDLTLEQILNGRVQFAIGETVWVNPLVDLGRDAVDSTIKTRSSIRLELIKLKCAENNDNHIKNILDLCRKTGFKCPELEVQTNNIIKDMALVSKFHDIGDDYQWAFVTTCKIENPETVEIWTSFTKNPHCIFGTNGKYDSELNAVIRELNDSVSELIGDRCADYATQFASYYQEGMIVAVKDRIENSWQRGLILDIHNEKDADDGQTLYDVFLVDMGDEQKDSVTSELFPIFRNLVTKLPFQAISFELAHIKPIEPTKPTDSEWNEAAIEGLFGITLDDDNNGVMFDVVALQTRNHDDKSLPCRCYSAFMFLQTGEDVGESLVSKGLASYVKDDRDLKFVKQNILSSLNRVYDRHHAELDSNDDDDDDRDDNDVGSEDMVDLEEFDDKEFDVVGFNENTVLNALGIEKSDLPGGINLPSCELNESDRELHTTNKSKAVVQNGVKADNTCTLGAEQASGLDKALSSPFSSLKHPTVYWRQTPSLFILKVNQVDIRDYTLDIDKKKISFRTLDPPNYGFDIECFGTIEKTPQVFCTGQYLKITCKKRTNWPWPRPLQEQGKVRWLKEDIDRIDVSDDDEQEDSTKDHPVVVAEAEESESSESDVEDVANFVGGDCGESDDSA